MSDKQNYHWHLQRLATTDHNRIFSTFAIILFILALMIIPYSMILQYVSRWGDALGNITLLVIQLFIGLPTTRAAFQLGTRMHESQTPPTHNGHLQSSSFIETPLSDSALSQIFERFQLYYHRASSKRIDDYTDIGWFLVVVFAITTTMIAILFAPFALLCISIPLVQEIVIFFSIVLGFNNADPENIDDSLMHLEFVVLSLVRRVMDTTRDFNPTIVARWLSKFGRSIIYDIAIVFSSVEFRFHIGSKSPASILMRTPSNQPAEILKRLPTDWVVLQHDDILEIRISDLMLDMSQPTSWLLPPDTVEHLSTKIGTTLIQLLSAK